MQEVYHKQSALLNNTTYNEETVKIDENGKNTLYNLRKNEQLKNHTTINKQHGVFEHILFTDSPITNALCNTNTVQVP